MQWMKISQIVFGLTMIGIGIIGLVGGGFAPIWAGVPKALPDRQLLAYACTFVSLACGAGLLLKRTAAPASFALLVYLIVWTALFEVPFIIHAPLVEVSYQMCGENAVLISAAWFLLAWSARDQDAGILARIGGPVGVRIARLLYGLALLAFGFSHFAYLDLTAPLVPAWLPGHVFWAYFTGAVYLLTGLAVASGFAARLGTALSALQISLITILVWGPFLLAGEMSAMHWQETVVSWALTAASWVVAASFDGSRWFEPLALPAGRKAAAAQ